MALITTIQDFKKYVTITVTSQNNISMPNMDMADENYLWPVLTKTVYSAMVDVITNHTDIWNRLRELCKRVVAPMALADMLSKKQVSISDVGIHSTNSETLVSAHRWEYLELKNSLYNDAAKAQEKLWEHLFLNGDDYSWENPLPQKTLFTSGEHFSQFFYVPEPYTVFSSLLPIIAEVEDKNIYTAMGKDFVESVRDNTTPTTEEKELLTILRKAVANLAISEACSKMAVKITNRGFTVLMGDSGDQPYKGDQDSSFTLKKALRDTAAGDGIRYITDALTYLNKQASTTIFPTFFSSIYYVNPITPKGADANKYRKGFYM